MSEPLTNTQLKNRLLGAALLVVLAVLLIPLFLGEPKQSTPEVATEGNNGFQSRIQPLPDTQSPSQQDAQNAASQANTDGGLVLKKFDQMQPVHKLPAKPGLPPPLQKEVLAPVPVEKVIEPKIAAPEPEKVVKKAPVKKKVVKVPEKKVSEKKQVSSGWVVQAGIFSKTENAKSIAKVLSSNGHKPKLSEARTSFGKATRVWIGPFINKSDAQALSKKIEQQTGNGGYVAQYPFKS